MREEHLPVNTNCIVIIISSGYKKKSKMLETCRSAVNLEYSTHVRAHGGICFCSLETRPCLCRSPPSLFPSLFLSFFLSPTLEFKVPLLLALVPFLFYSTRNLYLYTLPLYLATPSPNNYCFRCSNLPP